VIFADFSPCSESAPCFGAEAVDDFEEGDPEEASFTAQLRHIVIDGSNLAMRLVLALKILLLRMPSSYYHLLRNGHATVTIWSRSGLEIIPSMRS